MVESRRTSARIRTERRLEKSPEPSTVDQRPKKIRKIHAKNPSDAKTSIQKDSSRSTIVHESSSQHVSPGTSSSRLLKETPLPVRRVQSPTTADVTYGPLSLQSIAESGVLAASLSRSRAKWVNEGIFERYWSKPKKSRGQIIEVENNPPKDSMVQLGRSKLSVEPHVFEVYIHGIRDVVPPMQVAPKTGPVAPSAGVSGSQPLYPSQASDQKNPTPTSNAALLLQYSNNPKPSPQIQSSQPVQVPPNTQSSQPMTPTQTVQPVQAAQSTSQPTPAMKPQESAAPIIQSPQQNQQVQQTQQARPAGQDPVIQMLAQRASENPELKELMKIVASGTANKEQLAEFQRHIDELTRILHQRNVFQQQTSIAGNTQTPTVNNSQSKQGLMTPQSNPPYPQQPKPAQYNNTSNIIIKPPVQHLQSPVARAPKPAAPTMFPASTRFKGIALEILDPTARCNTTPNDRLLFPRNTILNYHPSGRSVTASFLVVKTVPPSASSSTLSTSLEAEPKKLHVPITVLFESPDQQALAHLRAGVAPEVEVSKYMDDIVRDTERASEAELALRLPLSEKHNAGQTTSSEPVPVPVPRRGRRKEEDLDVLCRFCYGPIAEGSIRDRTGRLACKDCANLRAKAAAEARKIVIPAEKRDVQASGVLVW